MKWDIDKALKSLEVPGRGSGTGLNRVLLDVTLFERHGLKPTQEEADKGYALVWCLGIGVIMERKAFFYDRKIRSAYLKARRAIRDMTQEERKFFGVQLPRRSNNYLAAKRKAKRGG